MTEPALLVLEDGRVFRGERFGALGQSLGEAVFCTAMTGYQETLTDPSYHGQIVVATAPQIGNTGWNDEDDDELAVAPLARRRPGVPGDRRRRRDRHPGPGPAPARARRDAVGGVLR
jgi:carbamoyl-phosphate synthase small subunit